MDVKAVNHCEAAIAEVIAAARQLDNIHRMIERFHFVSGHQEAKRRLRYALEWLDREENSPGAGSGT